MLLYRIYQFLIMAPVLLVATILTACVTSVGSLLGFGRWSGYYPPRLWARLFCLMTFVKVTVSGRGNIDRDTSYVFVANHQGAYDIFSIYGYLNHQFRWMMKKELRKIPVVGYACEVSGQIYVDNSTPHAIATTMQKAEQQLRGGMSLVVFPEGARTLDGRMHRFKRGAYRLAMEFSLPVVPVTIDGAFDVLPRTGILPRPGHIHLTIHKPILAGEEGHCEKELMQQSRDAIASVLEIENNG